MLKKEFTNMGTKKVIKYPEGLDWIKNECKSSYIDAYMLIAYIYEYISIYQYIYIECKSIYISTYIHIHTP